MSARVKDGARSPTETALADVATIVRQKMLIKIHRPILGFQNNAISPETNYW
jgi:hypothetical protein